ncbi:hypothetical protein [Paenibacillus macerans]|uniref:hypothetical protein n=1 Tax=Paenibacillus macerans TaxID=44252 RepID=UPI000E078F5E|nr:hypothetical protein [Paenibacillus macerans]MEC0152391.1 hypothetical protein [Paenibacillus macerans]SUA83646.1 Uncharacterised protein [Paenibacillus macerans]
MHLALDAVMKAGFIDEGQFVRLGTFLIGVLPNNHFIDNAFEYVSVECGQNLICLKHFAEMLKPLSQINFILCGLLQLFLFFEQFSERSIEFHILLFVGSPIYFLIQAQINQSATFLLHGLNVADNFVQSLLMILVAKHRFHSFHKLV